MYIQKQISQKAYQSDGFIGNYRKLVRETVIPYQYAVFNDQVEGVEKSHAISNFINAGKVVRGEQPDEEFYGERFQDSDVAKWIEAAAYSLADAPDKELEGRLDSFIDLIAEAQDENGYLDTYFTLAEPDKRWSNLWSGHELYCAGHMMEAACAYYEVTGKRKLLDVMLKNAEYLYNEFVIQRREGWPGHPEVELALMKVYKLTGNEHCLRLAEYFIDVRGQDPEFFPKEQIGRNRVLTMEDLEYNQSVKPVREQETAVGHAVRAVYLYTAMAHIAAETDDDSLLTACKRLWENITKKRMYITGGIGSTGIREAFTVDYDLPGDTAYCETCASLGLMFFASRMLENEINGEYADVMERAFYNTALAGMQLDGKRFFYVNPLECIPGITGKAVTHKHDLTQRPGWYSCACCPPNLARTISSFGKYAYGENETTVFCHLYAGGEVAFQNGIKLSCQTEYPYGFTVVYRVLEGSGKMAIRIPKWSKENVILRNGTQVACESEKGYVYLEIMAGDEVTLTLDDQPYFVYPSSRIPAITGKVAVCRGPLVYCFEGVDNNGDVLSLALKRGGRLSVAETDVSLGNAVKIKAEAVRVSTADELYTAEPPKEEACTAVAIPYYAWCNRGENQMRVWMTERV